MKIALAGLNHKTAPVEVREQLAIASGQASAILESLHAQGIPEAVVLSTCNRVEVLAALSPGTPGTQLADVLAARAGATAVREHMYVYEDQAAVRHLFRVAASLDSMVVGEPQILGQLKQAFAEARDHGSVGTVLDAVVSRAFHVAKRIRTETEIGQNAVSVSFAAVELAREIFGSLARKRVLIVGAGKMSEATGRHLLRAGVSQVWVTNRTTERAEQLASMLRGNTIPYESIAERLHSVDIVITSSAAPGYVLTAAPVQRAIEARRNEPMFFIDIAVPRNIDPRVNGIEHAFLYDIDDLAGVAARNLAARAAIAKQAESIIDEELQRLEARMRERGVAPTIQGLQQQLEAIRQEAILRYRSKLGALTQEQEEAIEAMTRAIVNKVAHGPISELRKQAAAEQTAQANQGELVTAVRRMFGLR